MQTDWLISSMGSAAVTLRLLQGELKSYSPPQVWTLYSYTRKPGIIHSFMRMWLSSCCSSMMSKRMLAL